jgi:small GTP-binding protein
MIVQEPHYKVVLLGDSGVGKTAIVERIAEDIFPKTHVPTVGAQFISLEVQIGDQFFILELWDTAGQEVFRSLAGFYARDAKGAFVLYDIANKESFTNVPKWLSFVTDHSPSAKIILFGNKIDLADDREVAKADGEALAAEKGLIFFEGSAKTSENVRDAFERMTELVTQCQQSTQSPGLESDASAKGACC